MDFSVRPLDPAQLSPPFQSYLDAFCKLAEEEGLDYDRKRLARVLSKFNLSDIERVYDACQRFGLTNIIKTI